MVSSISLGVEKMSLLKNPSQQLICDLNPIISCGGAMRSSQSSFMGIDNSLLGAAAFGALTAVGVTILAGATFKRWFWRLINLAALGGFLASHYLIFTSLYVINTLCPFCMAIWVVTVTSFLYITLYNIEFNNIKVPTQLRSVANFARKYHLEILVSWAILLLALILKRFWYYYGPAFGF